MTINHQSSIILITHTARERVHLHENVRLSHFVREESRGLRVVSDMVLDGNNGYDVGDCVSEWMCDHVRKDGKRVSHAH